MSKKKTLSFRLTARNLRFVISLKDEVSLEDLLEHFKIVLKTYIIIDYLFVKTTKNDVEAFVKLKNKADIKNPNYFDFKSSNKIDCYTFSTISEINEFQMQFSNSSFQILASENILSKLKFLKQDSKTLDGNNLENKKKVFSSILNDEKKKRIDIKIKRPLSVFNSYKDKLSFNTKDNLLILALDSLGITIKQESESKNQDDLVVDYLMMSLSNLDIKYKVLGEILASKKSNQEKQLEIETNRYSFLKSIKKLKYFLNKYSKSIVLFLDYMVCTNCPEEYNLKTLPIYANAYFRTEPSQTFLNCVNSDIDKLLKESVIEKIPSEIKSMLIYKNILIYSKQSLGLTVMHALSIKTQKTLTEVIDQTVIDQKKVTSQILIDNINKYSASFTYKRLTLKEEMVSELQAQFYPLINGLIATEKQDLLLFLRKNLNELNLEEELEQISSENYEFKFSPEFKSYLGDFIFILLEQCGVLKSELVTTIDSSKKKSIKTTTYIKINDSFLKSIFKNVPTITGLPQIELPRDWSYKENTLDDPTSNVVHLGGYLINKFAIFPAVRFHTKESYGHVSETTLDALNYLQKTPFQVNSDFLQYIEDNFIKMLLNYVEYDTENFNQAIFLIEKNLDGKIIGLEFKSLSTFLDFYKSEIQQAYRKNIIIQEKNLKNISVDSQKYADQHILLLNDKKNLTKLLSEGSMEYLTMVNKVARFLDIFMTAYLFEEYTLYYSWYLDFRGRIYPDSSLLHPQGSSFAKSLIDIQNKTNIQLDINDPYFKLQVAEWDKKAAQDKSKCFFSIRFREGFPSAVVNLDVSASGFQLYCALLGIEEGLILTNFFASNEQKVKNDFYRDFIHSFLKDYDDKIFKQISKTPFLESVTIDIKTIFQNRDFVKDLLVSYLYSEGGFSRSNKITEELERKMSLKTLDFIDFYKRENQKNKDNKSAIVKFNSEIAKIVRAINTHFESTFKKKYSKLYEVKKYLETAFVKNSDIPKRKGVLLKTALDNNSSSLFYSLLKQDVLTTEYYNATLKKFSHYNQNFPTTLFDARRAKNGIGPNLIHRLDSEVLVRTIVKCKEANIPLTTAHDCLITFYSFEKIVKKAYYESVCEVFFYSKDLPLEIFLASNNAQLESFGIEKLNNIRKSVAVLREKIKKKKLKMSSFILTP